MSTQTLGRYHIIRELARSNDIVYEAMDPALGKKIALKELNVPPNLTGKARHDRIQRFTREARAAAGLHHSNIVRILEHGQVDGRYFIAMEFLEGQSLRDVLRQRGSLPPQEALRIAAAVAEGLEYAHRHGVVHRDVKPDNVHLEPDGRVVITDFGIARLTFEPTLTADGQIFGTPSYMSPEQVKGGDVDRRSDLFSLGVMLYEMLAGRKPFTGDSVITITYNIMNVDPPPLPGPQGVDAIMRCALAKEPRFRYPSAQDMAEDLKSLSAGGQARRALAIMPAGSGVRVGTAASLGAPVPVTRTPAPPPGGAPVSPAGRMQPGPGGAGLPAGVRPMPVNGGVPRGAVPAAARPAPAMPPGFVAAPPRRRRSSSGQNIGWLLGWLGVAAVIGLLILTMVWASVTAMDRTRQADADARVQGIRAAADRSYREGKFEDALNSYRSVAEAAKGKEQLVARRNAALAANELAKRRMSVDKLDEAESYCQQAIQLDPNTLEAYVTLGGIYHRLGRIDDAVQQYDLAIQQRDAALQANVSREQVENAVKLAVGYKSNILYQDGVAQARRGNVQLAVTRFQAAAEAAPSSPSGIQALEELRRLRDAGVVTAPAPDPGGGSASGAGGAPFDPGLGGPGSSLPPPGTTVDPIPSTGGTTGAPQRPRGWNDSYKNF